MKKQQPDLLTETFDRVRIIDRDLELVPGTLIWKFDYKNNSFFCSTSFFDFKKIAIRSLLQKSAYYPNYFLEGAAPQNILKPYIGKKYKKINS